MADERLNATSFKVTTYNVWFGRDGRGGPYPKERMEAIVELLKAQSSINDPQCPLLVCGFQEVLPELCDAVLQPMLGEAGYRLLCQPGMHYKCAIAVHRSLEIVQQGWCPYEDTVMNRGFLYVQFRVAKSEQQILFATTHLESPINREGTTNTAARVNQIRALEAFCNEQTSGCSNLKTAIIAGDLNWSEQGRDVPLLSSGLETCWKDAWLETCNSPGFTFDCPLNPFLDGDRCARLDRILVRDRSFYQPYKTSLIGQDPLAGLTIQKDNVYEQPADGFSTPVKKTRNVSIVPSDHFGVTASLRSTDCEWRSSPCD